jgi:hypothetical protein
MEQRLFFNGVNSQGGNMPVKGQKPFAVFVAPDAARPKSAARYGAATGAQITADNTVRTFINKKHLSIHFILKYLTQRHGGHGGRKKIFIL